jgi:TrmH family RNA methyltransferase
VPDITSRRHAIVQAFKLAARGERDRALLDGWHLLHDAVAAGLDVVTVAIAGRPPTPRDEKLIERLMSRADVYSVTTSVMEAMSPVRTPTGVVALVRPRAHALHDLLRPAPALVIVAADVQDPGNVGAIVRAAEAGGATGTIFLGASANPWSWKALRAAMGSTLRLPVALPRGPHSTLDDLRAAGLTLMATVPRGGVLMHHSNLRGPVAVILGAEGRGLDEAMIRGADEQLSIPMHEPVESLNVAVTAALLVYEARRQRHA